MKNTSILCLLTFIVLLSPGPVYKSYASVPNEIIENKKNIVTIYINSLNNIISSGTGFVVEPNGLIVTNYHVIAAALNKNHTISARTENGSFLMNGDVNNFDEKKDIALIKFDVNNLNVVKINYNYIPKLGENIYVIGSPMGLDNTISEGIISSIRNYEQLNNIIQFTAPISSGSSGSPLFNSNGEVIGITTFLISNGQNLNFAIPISYLNNLLNNNLNKHSKKRDLSSILNNIDIAKICEKADQNGLIKQNAMQGKLNKLKNDLIIDDDVCAETIKLYNYFNDKSIYDDGIKSLHKCITKNPNNIKLYCNLLFLYELKNKTPLSDETKIIYNQALTIKAENFHNLYYKNMLENYSLYKDISKYNKVLKKILKTPLKDLNDYITFLSSFYEQKDIKKFKKALDELLKLIISSSNRDYLIKKSYNLFSSIYFDDTTNDFLNLTINFYKELIKLNPDNIDLLIKYALIIRNSKLISKTDKIDITFSVIKLLESQKYSTIISSIDDDSDIFFLYSELSSLLCSAYPNNFTSSDTLIRGIKIFPNLCYLGCDIIVSELITTNNNIDAHRILDLFFKILSKYEIKKSRYLHVVLGQLYVKENNIESAIKEYKLLKNTENNELDKFDTEKLFKLIYK